MLKRCAAVIVVLVSMIFAREAFSQSNMGFMGVGAKLGLVDPEVVGSVIGFGGLVDLGTITPDIMLEANLEYWSKSEGVFGAEVSFRDLIIGGTGKYLIKSSNPKFRPFAGGGLALHLFKATSKVSDEFEDIGFGSTEASSTETRIGFHLGGGLFYELSPQLDLLVDGRYSIVSDANQLALQAGVVYKLVK
jgi:hypothetical protein